MAPFAVLRGGCDHTRVLNKHSHLQLSGGTLGGGRLGCVVFFFGIRVWRQCPFPRAVEYFGCGEVQSVH